MLIGQFWGTSAAEGVPAPFCKCRVCENARKVGGKEIRLRSCFRLSDKIMLDLGADAVVQSTKFGEISSLNHVFITHTHDDHLNPHMLMEAMWFRAQRDTLHYYFTDKAYEIVKHWKQNSWILKGRVEAFEKKGYVAFHKLEWGKTITIENFEFTPFKGSHLGNVGENSAMYLVKLPDGRTLFYGLDSGPYLPETIEALKNYHIDIFITECSFGSSDLVSASHMNLKDLNSLVEALINQGTLTKDSTTYITHINHHTSHTDFIAAVEKFNFPNKTIVAYDSLKIL